MDFANLPEPIQSIIFLELDFMSSIQLRKVNLWFNKRIEPTWKQLEEWYLSLPFYRLYSIEPNHKHVLHPYPGPTGQVGPTGQKGARGPRGWTDTPENRRKERLNREYRLNKLKLVLSDKPFDPQKVQHTLRIISFHTIDDQLANMVYASALTCDPDSKRFKWVVFGLCILLWAVLFRLG